MNILWFTWRDLKNPHAGGAELINEEIAKRLVRDGHQVKLVVGGFEGGISEETRYGYRIIRLGNRYTVYWHAYRYYKRNLRGWANLVIDEMNTIPFCCKYYVKERNVLLAYQLCREIWFYQMPFPFSVIGYILEPIYLWFLNDRTVITESESTKRDLLRYGYDSGQIKVVSIGIKLQPIKNIDTVSKYDVPTILSLGSMRSMKRTADQIKAFEIAKIQIPELQLKVAGSAGDRYGQKVLKMINQSHYAKDIQYLGTVSEDLKTDLMQKSHAIMVTSIKEGWGLIVTEANSQGTPAIVYNIDGLRDSVKHRETGVVCENNTPRSMSDAIMSLLSDQPEYGRIRKNAWLWSQRLTFTHCYEDFLRGISLSRK